MIVRFFTIPELCRTDNDDAAILLQQANPPAEVVANLEHLAETLLDPFRAIIGPLHVNSGWRCAALQAAQPLGSATSVHPLGLAADVVPYRAAPFDAMEWLVGSGLPFDQAIFERHRSVWIHVGAARRGHVPGRQALMMLGPRLVAGRLVPVYEPWNPRDPRFP